MDAAVHTRESRITALVFVAIVLALASASRAAAQTTIRGDATAIADERLESGVVVAGAPQPGSAPLRAGLQVGDVILSWSMLPPGASRPPTPITSPFAWSEFEIEHAPRGTFVLAGARDGAPREWTLTPGVSELTVRPTLPAQMRALYERGRERLRAGEIREGSDLWRQVATAARDAGSGLTSAWLLVRTATVFASSGFPAEAESLMLDARQQLDELNRPELLAQWHRQRGRWYQQTDPARAKTEFELALALDQRVAETSLSSALDHALIGVMAYMRGDFSSAEQSATRALALRQQMASESAEVGISLQDLSAIFGERGDQPRSADYLQRSMAVLERTAPGSLLLATCFHNLGIHAQNRGELEKAEELYRRGLAIRQAALPNGLAVSVSYNSLALVARERGDLEQAEKLHKDALTIQERVAAGGSWMAASLGNLGIVERRRGDLAAAEQYLRRALELNRKLAPDSLDVASDLNNLGNVMRDRGDVDQAENLFRQALAIRERINPASILVAGSFNNIATVAMDRRDYSVAEDYLRRALALKERLAPRTNTTVVTLNNLADVALARNDLPRADMFLGRALNILDEIAPRSIERLATLHLLSDVAARRKDFLAAREYGLQAIKQGEAVGSSSVELADAMQSLGDTLLRSGDIAGAETQVARSLEISTRVAPGSRVEAAGHYVQGLIDRQAGRDVRALESFERAIAAFERQTTTVGGAHDVRSSFVATGANYYHEAAEIALRINRPAEAFEILERSRARAFLDTLAERDLMFEAEIPADIAREQRLTQAEYDRTVAALSALGSDKQAEINKRVVRLRELRDRRDELVRQVRQFSPRLAALKYPQPLDVEGVRASLDAGTVLLAYWVGPRETRLFLIQPPGIGPPSGLTVLPVPAGESRIRALVKGLLSEIRTSPTPTARAVGALKRPDPGPAASVHQTAAQLYDLLLKPAATFITPGTHLLIVPDGPLHMLPFSVLRVRATGARPARYLIESNPISTVVSATVYEQSRRNRLAEQRAATPLRLVAFGDPLYPPPTLKLPEIRPTPQSKAERGFALTPLPATRKEVQGIARLFPGAADVFLGADATEERAKAIGRDASYVHIASHALLDEYLPLNSALVFSIPSEGTPGRANGLLQVWEVFEQVRLDADLVTLSACETGLGTEVSGEGLIGLTRAFQFAGARSVVASLWSVADDSTAQLMLRFYTHLRAGESKDEALRSAQLEAIRGKTPYSHPFHWAAFQLFGDSK